MPSAVVITCSNRASSGVYADRSGPLLVSAARAWGFETGDAVVVPDGAPVGQALRNAIASGAHLVLTTGGTGLTPTDQTPEQTAGLLDREVPGIPEALRAAGARKGIATAVLSRGLAGVAGGSLVINLPGSTGGVKDAIEVLADVVVHAVAQIQGAGPH
ncbi:MAG: molybdopterin-binding protein [Actinomycetota bacterium]|nr:molybdopterin-binding protein [Actinomycetota bacterium]